MTGFVFLSGILAALAFLLAFGAFHDDYFGFGLSCTVMGIFFVWCCGAAWKSPEELAKIEEAKKAQQVSEVTPRKVSSADGCTVYAFRPSDRWLYFTKCDNAQTTTQNQWTVNTGSGKTHSSHEETMEIKTK